MSKIIPIRYEPDDYQEFNEILTVVIFKLLELAELNGLNKDYVIRTFIDKLCSITDPNVLDAIYSVRKGETNE